MGFLFGPFGLAASFMAGDYVKCPACRKQIHPEAKKCPHCQENLANDPSPVKTMVVGVTCPKCGSRNDSNWKVCGRCSGVLGTGDFKATYPGRTSVSKSDLASQIERLAELHSNGQLSAEEFQQAKSKLLGE